MLSLPETRITFASGFDFEHVETTLDIARCSAQAGTPLALLTLLPGRHLLADMPSHTETVLLGRLVTNRRVASGSERHQQTALTHLRLTPVFLTESADLLRTCRPKRVLASAACLVEFLPGHFSAAGRFDRKPRDYEEEVDSRFHRHLVAVEPTS